MKVVVILVFILTLITSGCATVRPESKEAQIQQLQAQISELRTELQQKDEEIDYLGGQLANKYSQKTDFSREKGTEKIASGTVKMTPRNIQIALKRAGLYNGPTDGIIGGEIKKAIKEFQKTNGLKVDGIAGKKTLEKLTMYLK